MSYVCSLVFFMLFLITTKNILIWHKVSEKLLLKQFLNSPFSLSLSLSYTLLISLSLSLLLRLDFEWSIFMLVLIKNFFPPQIQFFFRKIKWGGVVFFLGGFKINTKKIGFCFCFWYMATYLTYTIMFMLN